MAAGGLGRTVVCFLEAIARAGGTAAAVDGDAEFAPQVAQCSRTTLSGFVNLTIGDCLADANVHERAPEFHLLRTILILCY